MVRAGLAQHRQRHRAVVRRGLGAVAERGVGVREQAERGRIQRLGHGELAVLRRAAPVVPRRIHSRHRAEQPGIRGKDAEAGLQLAGRLVELSRAQREVAQAELEPGELLARHAVPMRGGVAGLPHQAPGLQRTAAKLFPSCEPGRDPEIRAVGREHPEEPSGLRVVAQLQLGLGDEAARRDRRRVGRQQHPADLERVHEPVLGQQARGQHAVRLIVAGRAQRQRMPGDRLRPDQIGVVGRFARPLQVEARELGEVAGAPRIPRHAGLVERDVELADARGRRGGGARRRRSGLRADQASDARHARQGHGRRERIPPVL